MQITIKPWSWYRVLASTIWGLLSIGAILLLAAVLAMLPESIAEGPRYVLATILLGCSSLIPPYMLYLRAFPQNFDCMKYAGKGVSYGELKREVESEVFREPFALCDRRGRPRDSRILFSDKWIALEGTDGDPICIPRGIVDAVDVLDARGISLGDLPPVGEKHCIRFVLNDGRDEETSMYVDGKDLDRVWAFLEREFPGGERVELEG